MAQAPNGGMVANVMQSIFGKAPASANTQTPPNNGTANPAANASDPQNPGSVVAAKTGQDPNGKLPTGEDAPKGDESPLAGYEDLFTIEGKKTDTSPFTFDEKKFDETLKGMDFSKGVNPELMQKALAGDQAAFMQVLNQVSQASFSVNSKLTTRLVRQALEKQRTQILSELPSSVSSHQTQQSLIAENPALNHPILKPMLTTIESQLRNKFPEASDADISAHAKKVMHGIATQITGKTGNEKNDSQNRGQGKETDWAEYAGIDFTQM